MKNIFYKAILISLIVSSTNIFGMQRVINYTMPIRTGMNRITNFIGQLQSRTHNFGIQKLIDSAEKIKLKMYPPELTKENIKKYPQFKEHFIKEAAENLLKYTKIINELPILYELFDQYEEEVAIQLITPAIKHFDQIMDSPIPVLIMTHNKDAARLFIEPALKNFNDIHYTLLLSILSSCPDVLDLFVSLFLDNFELKITKDKAQQYSTNILLVYMMHNKIIFSKNINLFIQKIVKHSDKIMNVAWHCALIHANSDLYEELAEKTLSCTNKLFYDTTTKLKYFLNTLNTFQKGKDCYKSNIFENGMLEHRVAAIYSEMAHEEKNNFDKNYKIYLELFDCIKNKALENPTKYPLENLDELYPYLSIEEQEKLKKDLNIKDSAKEFKPTIAWIIQNLPNFNSKLKNLSNDSQNINIIDDNLHITGEETTTKHHVFSNLKAVHKMLTTDAKMLNGSFITKEKFKDHKVQEFLLNVYKKEKEERMKGNYVFYHGRNKNIRFSADIYKQLWKLKNISDISADSLVAIEIKEFFDQKQKLENFIFMRFEESKFKASHHRNDYLFMNHSLFGNAHESTGASTLTGYWLRDHSAHFRPNDSFSTKNLFAKPEFKLIKYFKKYENELKKLEEMHNNATDNGEIIMISVPSKDVNNGIVIHCGPGGYKVNVKINGIETNDSAKILDALNNDANSVTVQTQENGNWLSADYLEWKIDAYSLNFLSDLEFYSFYFMDEKSQKEYEDFRDQLFTKIKQDIETDKFVIGKKTSCLDKIISKL